MSISFIFTFYYHKNFTFNFNSRQYEFELNGGLSFPLGALDLVRYLLQGFLQGFPLLKYDKSFIPNQF